MTHTKKKSETGLYLNGINAEKFLEICFSFLLNFVSIFTTTLFRYIQCNVIVRELASLSLFYKDLTFYIENLKDKRLYYNDINTHTQCERASGHVTNANGPEMTKKHTLFLLPLYFDYLVYFQRINPPSHANPNLLAKCIIQFSNGLFSVYVCACLFICLFISSPTLFHTNSELGRCHLRCRRRRRIFRLIFFFFLDISVACVCLCQNNERMKQIK